MRRREKRSPQSAGELEKKEVDACLEEDSIRCGTKSSIQLRCERGARQLASFLICGYVKWAVSTFSVNVFSVRPPSDIGMTRDPSLTWTLSTRSLCHFVIFA